MHAKANAAIIDCYNKNRDSEASFNSMMMSELQKTVGEQYWRKGCYIFNQCLLLTGHPAPKIEPQRRKGELPESFDLLKLYQSDLGDRILSYASGADLCTLDMLNTKFNALTTDQWKVVTKDRFGMDNGKQGWKVGTSFLRPPVFVHNLGGYDEPEPDDGRPRIVTNDNIIAYTSDRNAGWLGSNIGLRDASTLKRIQSTISNADFIDKVSICGQVGSEIIVASTNSSIEAEAIHHNYEEDGDIPPMQAWRYNGTYNSDNGGVETIGCETHLITAHDGMIRLYEIKEEPFEAGGGGDAQELFTPRNGIRVYEGVAEEEGIENEDGVVRDMKLAWGPDKTHFIVGCTHKICVLKFEAAKNEISLVKTITVPNWEVTNVALAEDYIVASSEYKKVHIWNRSTGDKMVYGLQGGTARDALCDVGVDVYVDVRLRHDEEGFVRSLSFSCHGNILVSTSHIGWAVCIWDMKTGELLKRHMLPDGTSDVTDMVHLKKLNAFICMNAGYESMLAFPANQRQYEMATSIYYDEVYESESDESDSE